MLDGVAKSYDKSITLGRKGIDLYKDLPDYLKKDPDYPVFEKARAEGSHSDSGRKEVRDYLSPDRCMKFVDLGCCLNLMFNGYDRWPSTYYGVDISAETIKLLTDFSAKNKLNIGALYWGSIHETPFDDACFDIGACIGVLEYFEKDFIIQALKEIRRILKPGGRLVVDIPDNGGKMRRFMNLVEASMGRPDRFNISPPEFETLLSGYFEVEKTESLDSAAMIQYFLRRTV